MQLEISESTRGLHSLPLSSIRWTGIVAGLVVGIATHLLLMLLGTSIGLAAAEVGEAGAETTVPLAAGIWNSISMVLAALVGAYVAARSAGLRRASDGILHGIVAWGVTLLVMTFLATTALGAVLGSLFASPGARTLATQQAPSAAETARSISEGDRAEAVRALQSRLGVSSAQAGKLVDQALILAGREESASPAGRQAAQETLHTASLASGWLTAAIFLSLLAAVGGGWLGSSATHRVAKPQLHRHDVVADPASGRAIRTE